MERIDLDHVPADLSELEMRNRLNLERYQNHELRHLVQHRWFNRPLEERERIERQFREINQPRKRSPMDGYVRRRSPRDDFPPSAA